MYSEYQPGLCLSSYIDKYWEFKGSPAYGVHLNILPDGCTDFIFTLGEVDPTGDKTPVIQPYRSYFVGPMTKYSELAIHTPAVHLLGIRFLPCGIFRFMDLPLQELTDRRVNTTDLTSLFDHSFTERLCEQSDLKARINLIEQVLTQALKTPYSIDQQTYLAIQEINFHQGKLPIQTLMGKICLCQRHFERKFKQYTGFTPKEYSRIIKFRHAVNLLQQMHTDTFLSVAIDAGYYDTAHLSKEIKILSGKNASSFLSLDIPSDLTLTYI